MTDLVDGVGIVERPAAIHVCFPDFLAGLAAARVRGETAETAAAISWVARGNYSLELGFWTDVEFAVVDGCHRLFIKPGLDDMVGDAVLGHAANVCDVEVEHLKGVRILIYCVVW